LRSWSSTTPVYPVRTVVSAFLPALPCGPAWKPFFRSVLAFDLVSPVLLQNSARFAFSGRNPGPASAAIAERASSIIFCRPSYLLSIFLYIPPIAGTLAQPA